MSLFEKLQNAQREKDEKAKAEKEKPRLEIVPPVEPAKPASNEQSTPLAPLENSASLLAKDDSKLAPLPAKPASKLAKENKPASRSDAQRLADIRKSRGARTQIAIRINTEIKREIDAFLLEHDITQQDFFELAASSFMSKVLAETQSQPASKLALDERRSRLLYKTDTRIINLFLAYNRFLNPETTWKGRDDAVAFKYNSVDIRAVEIGILWTQSNYIELQLSDPPKSFKYYAGEIDKIVAQKYNDQMLTMALEFARDGWQRVTGREIDYSLFSAS